MERCLNFPKLYTACLVLNDFHGGDHQTFLSDSELREFVKSKKHLRVGSSKSYLKIHSKGCDMGKMIKEMICFYLILNLVALTSP